MNKLVILFTMEGCPHCETMKKQLEESNIPFEVRDIDKHEDEYEMLSLIHI
jgi:glutaredoxin